MTNTARVVTALGALLLAAACSSGGSGGSGSGGAAGSGGVGGSVAGAGGSTGGSGGTNTGGTNTGGTNTGGTNTGGTSTGGTSTGGNAGATGGSAGSDGGGGTSPITVTFDFDTATPTLTTGQGIPLDQTKSGVTAHLSSPQGSVFSIQSDSSTGWKMSQFSGNYVYDNDLNANTLVIAFDHPLASVSFNFATADFQQVETPTTLKLTAYLGASTSAVGTASDHGTYAGDTMPMGTLSFASTAPFDRIELSIPYQPQGASDYFVDNVTVTTQ